LSQRQDKANGSQGSSVSCSFCRWPSSSSPSTASSIYKDPYLGFKDREIPPRLLDLFEREDDCVVCRLHGIALRAESLPFDVSHGMFLRSHFNIDFVGGH